MAKTRTQPKSQSSSTLSAVSKPSTNPSRHKDICAKCCKSDGRKNGRICAKCITYYHDRCISSKPVPINWHCYACTRRKTAREGTLCKICMKVDKRMIIVHCTACSQSFHRVHVADVFKVGFDNWTCNFCLFPLTNADIHENLAHTQPPLSPVLKPFDDSIRLQAGLRVAHINIRSLRRNLPEIMNLVKLYKLDALFLSETFLCSDTFDHEISIENYTLIRKDRGRHGGGIVAYISDSISMEYLDTSALFCPTEEYECVSVNILLPHTKAINLTCMYRPPSSSLIKFTDNVSDFYKFVHGKASEIHILGDMNVDILNDQRSSAYLKVMSALGFQQLITSPTRVTCTSETLIDHIFTNRASHIQQSGTIPCGMSDHDLIFLVRKKPRMQNQKRIITFRSFKNVNIDNLKNDIDSLPWNVIDSYEDSNELLDNIHKLLLPVLNKHCPISKRSVRSKAVPWMTGEVIDYIRIRDKLKHKFVKTKEGHHWEAYKKVRNAANNAICTAKKSYYSRKFTAAKDSDSVWKAYFSLVNKKDKLTTINELF